MVDILDGYSSCLHHLHLRFMKIQSRLKIDTVKPRYNAGRGRKNFEAKNRVIARSAL